MGETKIPWGATGVPFFWKGWGGPKPTSGGRLLDGREYNEFPESGKNL